MTTGILAAARHSRVIEGSGIGKRSRSMAGAAILVRCHMRKCAELRFADGNAVIVALHAQLTRHLRASVTERSPGKR